MIVSLKFYSSFYHHCNHQGSSLVPTPILSLVITLISLSDNVFAQRHKLPYLWTIYTVNILLVVNLWNDKNIANWSLKTWYRTLFQHNSTQINKNFGFNEINPCIGLCAYIYIYIHINSSRNHIKSTFLIYSFKDYIYWFG